MVAVVASIARLLNNVLQSTKESLSKSSSHHCFHYHHSSPPLFIISMHPSSKDEHDNNARESNVVDNHPTEILSS
jgi:hypothetical protein